MNHPSFNPQGDSAQQDGQVNKKVLMAIGITADLMGDSISSELLRAFEMKLRRYPEPWVLKALDRCSSEINGKLTLASIVTRVMESDGRPGPEEAWNMTPKSEDESVVWTEEMAQAFGVVRFTIEDDPIAARMGFIETYKKLVREAREQALPPKWTPSLGRDLRGRDGALIEAANKGRLSHEHILKLSPTIADTIATQHLSLADKMQRQALENKQRDNEPPVSEEVLNGIRKFTAKIKTIQPPQPLHISDVDRQAIEKTIVSAEQRQALADTFAAMVREELYPEKSNGQEGDSRALDANASHRQPTRPAPDKPVATDVDDNNNDGVGSPHTAPRRSGGFVKQAGRAQPVTHSNRIKMR